MTTRPMKFRPSLMKTKWPWISFSNYLKNNLLILLVSWISWSISIDFALFNFRSVLGELQNFTSFLGYLEDFRSSGHPDHVCWKIMSTGVYNNVERLLLTIVGYWFRIIDGWIKSLPWVFTEHDIIGFAIWVIFSCV